MTNNKSKPILVTGSHRSGTTWTGRMISLHPDVGFIWEPFSPINRPGICDAPFDKWFTYIDSSNESTFIHGLEKTQHFNYNFFKDIAFAKGPRDIAVTFRNQKDFLLHKTLKRRPLFKDPIALFSAEWFFKHFDPDMVVMIRHPAAFVSSIIINNMAHPFSHFLEQDALMEKYLKPYAEQIDEFTHNKKSLLEQGILLWNLCHHMISEHYEPTYPDWNYVKHEELSADPITGFSSLYSKIGLELTSGIRSEMSKFTDNKASDQHKVMDIKRNSKSNIKSWKKRLSEDDIKQIRTATEALSDRYYSSESWG